MPRHFGLKRQISPKKRLIKIGQLRAVNFANTGTREQNARNKRRKSKMDERLITLLSIWGWASFALIVILLACKGR